MSTDNLHLPQASRKLSERWLSPYSITKLVGTNTVELHLPHSMCIHLVVNISHIKPYCDHLLGQPVSAPGPSNITEDREEEYEVDYVVDSWYKGKCLEYVTVQRDPYPFPWSHDTKHMTSTQPSMIS